MAILAMDTVTLGIPNSNKAVSHHPHRCPNNHSTDT
jgi:hypothetical protein